MSIGRPPVKTRKPYLSPPDVEREPNGRRSRKAESVGRPVVYFIGSGFDGRIKVGRTSAPLGRLCDLQVSSPDPLRLLGFIGCATVDDSIKLESLLHKLLASKGRHLRGEWFKLTVKEIDAIEVALGLDVRKPENERSTALWPTAVTSH